MRDAKRKVTDDPVMGRIIRELEEKGLNAKTFLSMLGMERATFDNWKFGKSKSYMMQIDRIADVLGTSIDYLVRGKEMGGNSFTAQEIEIVNCYRKLNAERSEMVRKMLYDLSELSKFESSG